MGGSPTLRAGSDAILLPVRRAVDRAAFRRRLRGVASGRLEKQALQLGPAPDEALSLLTAECRPLLVGAPSLRRLTAALERSGELGSILDGLDSRDREVQLRSARLLGALRLEVAVPWLETLLANRHRRLRSAAARALGRISGVRAANALVRGLGWRRGSTARLAIELARASPDLYLEARLADPRLRRIRASLALALGLRRRRSGLPALLTLLESGNRTERVVSARAIGWLKADAAGAALVYALGDPDWQVRNAATKAIGPLTGVAESEISVGLMDRNARVRRTASDVIRLRWRLASQVPGGPRWR